MITKKNPMQDEDCTEQRRRLHEALFTWRRSDVRRRLRLHAEGLKNGSALIRFDTTKNRSAPCRLIVRMKKRPWQCRRLHGATTKTAWSALHLKKKWRSDTIATTKKDFGCMPKGLNDQADVKNEDRSIQIMDCSPKTAFQTESWDAVQEPTSTPNLQEWRDMNVYQGQCSPNSGYDAKEGNDP